MVAAELSVTAIPIWRVVDARLLGTVVQTGDVVSALGGGYTPAGQLLAATAQLARTIPARAGRGRVRRCPACRRPQPVGRHARDHRAPPRYQTGATTGS